MSFGEQETKLLVDFWGFLYNIDTTSTTHVLDIEDALIPALYAAGELVGGLWPY